TFSCRSVAGGVIGAPVEATERVLAERRMAILRRLAVAEADTADQACRATAEIVEAHPRDFSFALIYRINAGAKQARLARRVGIEASDPYAPALIDLERPSACAWPLERVLQGKAEKFFGLDRAAHLPGGFWPEPARAALLAPLAGAERLAGFVVLGASPRFAFDSSYADFFELFAAALAGALARAGAREQSRAHSATAALLDELKEREAERAREAPAPRGPERRAHPDSRRVHRAARRGHGQHAALRRRAARAQSRRPARLQRATPRGLEQQRRGGGARRLQPGAPRP